jgi:putative FmdB family regulatory protein
MPVYAFLCPQCGDKREIFRPVAEHYKGLGCRECGSEMHKDYKAMQPAYHDVNFDSVDFDVTGKPFVYHTRGQLKDYAKRHGVEVDFGTSHKNHGEGRRVRG